jgi:probable HAF family extracellular repeat protein
MATPWSVTSPDRRRKSRCPSTSLSAGSSQAHGWSCRPFSALRRHSQAVGQADTKIETHAFLWHAHEMTDLGTLPGGRDSAALALNEQDQIVGSATTKNGKTHAVLSTLRSG